MAVAAGGTNPISVVDDNPMSVRQWVVVILMIFLNALDGFDVLSSAFAAPGITKEWGIPRSELGIMLSAELIGMGFGSILLGSLADKIGRKPAMLICPGATMPSPHQENAAGVEVVASRNCRMTSAPSSVRRFASPSTPEKSETAQARGHASN